MAEQFVIRVQVDGERGSGRGGGVDGTAAVAAGASANLIRGRTLAQEAAQKRTQSNLQKAEQSLKSEVNSLQVTDFQLQKQTFLKNRYEYKYIGTARQPVINMAGEVVDEVETPFPGEGTVEQFGGIAGDFVLAHGKKIVAGGTALGLKLTNASISHKQYRSGDSYYNDQLNNSMRLAQYGIALGYGAAKGGPAGFALVAAGIAVNEGINLYTQNANFNYDRMMDTKYVHNIREVAGDLSYGRRRRGDR